MLSSWVRKYVFRPLVWHEGVVELLGMGSALPVSYQIAELREKMGQRSLTHSTSLKKDSYYSSYKLL